MKIFVITLICNLFIFTNSFADTNWQPAGVTADERVLFLKSIVFDGQPPLLGEYSEKFFLAALLDPSAKVREFAAGYVGGEKNLPKLIPLMISDPDLHVRESVALSISSTITSNGVDTCTGLAAVTKNLPYFLSGLSDDSTAQYVMEVLGWRYSGEKTLACCMSPRDRKKVIVALKEIERHPPKHTIASAWSGAWPIEALKNITEECVP